MNLRIIFFLCFAPLAALAQTSRGIGSPLNPAGGFGLVGPANLSFSLDGRYLPDQSGAVGETENHLGVSVPIYKDDKNSAAISAGAANTHLDNSVQLDSGETVSSDFYRFDIGGQYVRQLEEHRSYSLRASVGYAGDKPSRGKDIAFSFVGTYGYPSAGGKGYWVWMAFWANNSVLANYVPIPGLVYVYRGNEVTGIFGFPVTAFQWTPEDP